MTWCKVFSFCWSSLCWRIAKPVPAPFPLLLLLLLLQVSSQTLSTPFSIAASTPERFFFLMLLDFSSQRMWLGLSLCFLAFSARWTGNWATFFLHRRCSFSKERKINHHLPPGFWGSGTTCSGPRQNTPRGSDGCVLSVHQRRIGQL